MKTNHSVSENSKSFCNETLKLHESIFDIRKREKTWGTSDHPDQTKTKHHQNHLSMHLGRYRIRHIHHTQLPLGKALDGKIQMMFSFCEAYIEWKKTGENSEGMLNVSSLHNRMNEVT